MMFSRLIDFDPSHFITADVLTNGFMTLEEQIYNYGLMPGFISIMDATGVSFGHVGRINLVIMKKVITYIQEAFPIRLKAVYVINSSPIAETVFNLLKPFINKELIQLVKCHLRFS